MMFPWYCTLQKQISSRFSNMTTRSFEKEQKVGSNYTVERPKNAVETHADMLIGWLATCPVYVSVK